MVWATEAGAMLLVALLLANSMLWEPKVWVIYIAAGLFAVVDGLQRPSADAMLPRLVGHQDLPAATALMSLRWQLGLIVGPTVGGIIFTTFSISAGFAVDMATYVVALVFLARVRSMPSSKEAKKPSLAALFEGVKYAFSRQDLIGTYIIDLAAMTLAMPMALYPFWADQLNAPWALGMFYSAITVGSVLVTVTSGWTTRYRFHGRAVILAAIGWGLAIAVAGLSGSLLLVLLFLTIAGAFDMVSALFRANMWNQTIPDHFRGRLAGIELLSYSVGPLAGQLRAASIASATSLSFSVTSGGVLCAIVVAFLAFFLPKMWKYDVETNEFAVRERENRKNLENS
jgi:MFS family permease